MKRHYTTISIIGAGLMLFASAANAQQTLTWDNYCMVGPSQLCSSIEVGLTPNGSRTDFTIRLRNLEGSLGTTPWALYNVSLAGLQNNLGAGFGASPTLDATMSGTAGFAVTADAATCAAYSGFGGCDTSNWGSMEWDYGGSRSEIGSHIDRLPRPFGVVGCSVVAQPGDSYFGLGYFQTCGDGWVTFNTSLFGSWMFDDDSQLSMLAWDGTNMSSCQFGVTCVAAASMTSTPEPATLWLTATGVLGCAATLRYRRRRQA